MKQYTWRKAGPHGPHFNRASPDATAPSTNPGSTRRPVPPEGMWSDQVTMSDSIRGVADEKKVVGLVPEVQGCSKYEYTWHGDLIESWQKLLFNVLHVSKAAVCIYRSCLGHVSV